MLTGSAVIPAGLHTAKLLSHAHSLCVCEQLKEGGGGEKAACCCHAVDVTMQGEAITEAREDMGEGRVR